MGVINETLRLADAFSGPMMTVNQSVQRTNASMVMLDRNISKAMGQSTGALLGGMQSLTAETQETNRLLGEIIVRQQRVTEATNQTANAARGWASKLKGVAAAIVAAAGIGFMMFSKTADQMSSIDAKLRAITNSEAEAAALQEQIYRSAQRSRAAYTDTASLVARVGSNAREAFGNTTELVQFAENLNKSFVIAGATAEEQGAATLQLTQALASGVLRGEELNSVFEAAPNIIRTIADYLGVGVGEIRQMASEGQITAEVVKNAMLKATGDIDKDFEAMPMTLAQAFQVGKNAIQQSLRDSFANWSDFISSDEGQEALGRLISLFTTLAQVGVGALSVVGGAALFVSNNLEYIIPVLLAIGVAFAVVHAQSLAAAAANVAGGLATAAAWAAANWPVVLLAALLAALGIAAIQLGANFQQVGTVIGTVFGFLFAVGYNVFANLWNLIATFAEFFANLFNNPVANVAQLFSGLFDFILGIVETVAGAIDTLLGTNMSGAVSGFRSNMAGWVDETFGENAIKIKRMANLDVGATASQWGSIGGNLGSKLDNMNFSLESVAGSLSGFDASKIPQVSGAGGGLGDVGKVGSVGSVKSIEGDVKLSDEDMKIYRDLAERRYMNEIELKTLAPNINVTLGDGASAKNLNPKDVANAIAKVLAEQRGGSTSVVHA